MGYKPVWQEISATDIDLRPMLHQKIGRCRGVIQIVGQCFGSEPPTADFHLGRLSYTQYEALYARERGKKIWYLFVGEDFPADAHDPEPEELYQFQANYRRRLSVLDEMLNGATG